jgi:dTDP-4-amino-4,6-dideoxygalactose transaminase
MQYNIPFNKPYLTGSELDYIRSAVASGKISGDGIFTRKCHSFFEEKYNFHKVLLTTSCTDALEMAAILLDIKPGDEVIIPSYTFVSTVNPFILRGANIVFIDSKEDHPNINAKQIESLISPKTKAIVPVHYAGVACEMDTIVGLAKEYNLSIIEDAAQAIDSYHNGVPLGKIGDLGAFSFHETKNIISGEGGMLTINNEQFMARAEIIREKGTNRSSFFRGEVNKYGWMDMGSSFLPSDIIAAFLFAQLENIESIQAKRVKIWNNYYHSLKALADKEQFKLPVVFPYATNNAHMFYIICRSIEERTKLISYLKSFNINPVFHYISLHSSPFYADKHGNRMLKNADNFTNCLLRLPFYNDLTEEEQAFIIEKIYDFFDNHND